MTTYQHRVQPRRRGRRLLVLLAAFAIVATAIGAASAYFTSSGTGSGTGTVGTLNPPTNVTADQADEAVAVSWTAPTGPVAATGYYVERTSTAVGSDAEPACGTSPANPIAATSCTDGDVAPGTYTYRVTAVFRTWTAISAASDEVTVAADDQDQGRAAALEGQSITFGPLPSAPQVDDSFTLTATGGPSGKPVTFSAGTSGACTVSGDTVEFVGAGTCTVYADQAGDAEHEPAATVEKTLTVAKAPQTVTFEGAAPDAATVGGPSYTPTAVGGGSGKPVTFTVDDSSASVCSISSGAVTFQGPGTCTVRADQAGNADYLPGGSQRSFAVAAAPAP